jgi:hypothetical protein
MINYTWQFTADAFEVYPMEGNLENVVKYIKWIRNAEEDKNKASNSATFICGEPDPDNYTPYDQITEEQVIQWLEAGLNMRTIDGALENIINEQKAPKTEILPNPF